MAFSEKVVLITGGSSGIGAATAVQFSTLRASVVITGRNMENLTKVAADCIAAGCSAVHVVMGDVTKKSDVENIFYETISRFGKLDILVNNAGILENGSIENTSLEQFDRIFKTNVKSVYHLTKLAMPYLISAKGSIVNVSSVAGTRSFPGILAYCMSKSAIDQFTKCLALDLAPKGIRVNSVNPGVIVTDIHRRGGMSEQSYSDFLQRSRSTHALGRTGDPREVACAITFLASEEASFITGENLHVDGGRHVMCPR